MCSPIVLSKCMILRTYPPRSSRVSIVLRSLHSSFPTSMKFVRKSVFNQMEDWKQCVSWLANSECFSPRMLIAVCGASNLFLSNVITVPPLRGCMRSGADNLCHPSLPMPLKICLAICVGVRSLPSFHRQTFAQDCGCHTTR